MILLVESQLSRARFLLLVIAGCVGCSSLQLEISRTMAYAIIKTGGKQYRVSEGQHLDVEKLELAVGDQTTLNEVLFYSDGSAANIGDPMIEGASVTASVIDQFRDKKVTAFKLKRRKGYHKTKGHRRHLTRLRIDSISA